MGADSRREREREAAREKQEGIDKGLGDRHREMGTQMKLRLSMVWGEEAVRRREEMTEPPEWPTEVSERSEFRREEYRDLPGPDPKRNVDHPDLGYLAVADRNWPRGEDGTCSGREWGWVIERGPKDFKQSCGIARRGAAGQAGRLALVARVATSAVGNNTAR